MGWEGLMLPVFGISAKGREMRHRLNHCPQTAAPRNDTADVEHDQRDLDIGRDMPISDY
jgi:hypothetical protein